MPLPHDLKNYRRTEWDGFQLMEPETAAALIFWALFACIVLDRLGMFAK